MYIQQAFNYLHDWWRYLVGAIIAFIASQIGSIPFLIVVLWKVMSDGGDVSVLEDSNALMTILDPNLTLFLMLLGFAVGLVGLLIVVKLIHKQPIKALTTSRKKIDWKRFWFSFSLIAVVTIFFTLLDYYQNPQDYVVQFQPVPFAILCIIAILFIPLQTSFEEYLFRGYLMQGIGVSSKRKYFPYVFIYLTISFSIYAIISSQYSFSTLIHFLSVGIIFGVLLLIIYSKVLDNLVKANSHEKLHNLFNRKWPALFTTSLIFGLLHIANPEVDKIGNIIMIYYIGTGLFLGILTLMDEGMELALGFHAGNNLIAAILVTADWTVFKTPSIFKDISDPSAGFDVVMPVLILYPILLAIMAYRYKWNNWSERLFGKVEEPPKPIENENIIE